MTSRDLRGGRELKASATARPRLAALGLVSLLKRWVLRPFAGPLLASRATSGLRMSAGTMRPAGVVAVVGRLEAVGIPVWLSGGWGVDALVGHQTRRHGDLDLLLDCVHEQRAVAELAALGYHTLTSEPGPGPLVPRRVVVYDAMGRSVDLHPVDLGHWLATAIAERLPDADDPETAAFAEGHIGERRVQCLSAALQIAAHEGYPGRDVDRHDLDVLQRLAPGPPAWK
jgi:lincosamide nucleotidyltransferase A/C/D/E